MPLSNINENNWNRKNINISIVYPTDVFSSKIGGIETFVKGFIQYAPNDFNIELIGITQNKSERPVAVSKKVKYKGKKFYNFPVIYTPFPNKKAFLPLSLKYTLALLRYRNKKNFYTILQFHRIEPVLRFCFSKKWKIFFSHGDIRRIYNAHSDQKWKRIPFLYFLIEKILIKNMKRIFVMSDKGAKYYKQLYPQIENKIDFCPTWVDTTVFYPLNGKKRQDQKDIFTEKLGFPRLSNIIVFVGRLESAKDPLLAVESIKAAYRNNQMIRMIIVGDGELKRGVAEIITSSEMDSIVIFAGTLNQKELANIMKISDALLMTSRYEGMSRVLLESLGCGVPVISTNVGEAKNIITQYRNGIVVKGREPEEIGQAINSIVQKDRQIDPNACVRSISPYTPTNVLSPIYSYYRELFNETPIDRYVC